MVVPMGGIDLNSSDKSFTNSSNLLLVAPITKKKNTLIPLYSLFNNDLGFAYARSFTKKYGSYVIASKSMVSSNSYLGFGLTRSVDKASLFIEVGSPLNSWKPGVYVGVFIPFTFEL